MHLQSPILIQIPKSSFQSPFETLKLGTLAVDMHKFLILCKKCSKTLGGFNGNHYLCSEKVAKLLTQHCTNKIVEL